MYRSDHVKPDGRGLWLYGREPIVLPGNPSVASPTSEPAQLSAHMRWHPLAGEWVIYAAHRQSRTFLPSADRNPLAPTVDPAHPTELPRGSYDVAVFENRFPSLFPNPGQPPSLDNVATAPAEGRCEVVVFAQGPELSLGQLSVDRIVLVLEVIADRTAEMARSGVVYALPFENRGREMGVTLHHPHAQIYGYGFLPAQQARTLALLREHWTRTGRNLVNTIATEEKGHKNRLVAQRLGAVAFVPAFARFPYETWVVPARHVQNLAALTPQERDDVAAVLKEVLQRLDGLWGVPMPYLLTVNQAPLDAEYPEWTLRIEIWPIRRAPDKLKYLAGTELGAGVFASDVLPERAAAELRAAPVTDR